MKKLFFLLFFIIIIVSACSPQETNEVEIAPGLPLSWITHQGDKYVFSEVYSDGEVGMEDVVSTNTFTGEGDGAESGKEVFIEQESGDLFIIDDSGPNEEWARFVKEKK